MAFGRLDSCPRFRRRSRDVRVLVLAGCLLSAGPMQLRGVPLKEFFLASQQRESLLIVEAVAVQSLRTEAAEWLIRRSSGLNPALASAIRRAIFLDRLTESGG